MIEGLNIEFAQCVMNVAEPAMNALSVTFGCVVEAAQSFRESQSGYSLQNDLNLLQYLPFSELPKTDFDLQVIAALKKEFVEVGLNWNMITSDDMISDIEFLQQAMLEDAKFLTEKGVDVTTFQPEPVHMTSAGNLMEALGITDADAEGIGMDIDQYQRLLAMKNMLDSNDATAAANWAPSIVASAPPTTSVASLDPALAQPSQP